MLDFPSPAGFRTDHNRVLLGTGSMVFDRSVAAVEQWEMFNLGWLTLCWPDTPIRNGEVVVVFAGPAWMVFHRSVAAVEQWEMFNLGWLTLCWPDTPIRTGEVVAVLAR